MTCEETRQVLIGHLWTWKTKCIEGPINKAFNEINRTYYKIQSIGTTITVHPFHEDVIRNERKLLNIGPDKKKKKDENANFKEYLRNLRLFRPKRRFTVGFRKAKKMPPVKAVEIARTAEINTNELLNDLESVILAETSLDSNAVSKIPMEVQDDSVALKVNPVEDDPISLDSVTSMQERSDTVSCDLCYKQFACNVSLMAHRKIDHYMCGFCGDAFLYDGELHDHSLDCGLFDLDSKSEAVACMVQLVMEDLT